MIVYEEIDKNREIYITYLNDDDYELEFTTHDRTLCVQNTSKSEFEYEIWSKKVIQEYERQNYIPSVQYVKTLLSTSENIPSYTKAESDEKYALVSTVNTLSSTVSTLNTYPHVYLYNTTVNDATAGKDMMDYMINNCGENGLLLGFNDAPLYASYIYFKTWFSRDFVMRVGKGGGVSFMFNQENTNLNFTKQTWHDVQFKGEAINVNDDSTINGILTINSSPTSSTAIDVNFEAPNSYNAMKIISPNMKTSNVCGITIGKNLSNSQSVALYYQEPGNGYLGLWSQSDIIKFSSTQINLNRNTTIKGDLNVSGNIKSNVQNTTITHYCPIEAGEDISKYEIGKPVFLSGHVYKYERINLLVH